MSIILNSLCDDRATLRSGAVSAFEYPSRAGIPALTNADRLQKITGAVLLAGICIAF